MATATLPRITLAQQVVSLFRTAPEVTTEMEKITEALGLTPEEKKEFSKVAREAGLSLEQLIRSLLRGYAEALQIRQ